MRVMLNLGAKLFAQSLEGVNEDGSLNVGNLEPSRIDRWIKSIEIEHPLREDEWLYPAHDLAPIQVHEVTHQPVAEDDSDNYCTIVSSCIMMEMTEYLTVVEPKLHEAGWHLESSDEVEVVGRAPLPGYAQRVHDPENPPEDDTSVFPPSLADMIEGRREVDEGLVLIDVLVGMAFAIEDDMAQGGAWMMNSVQAFLYSMIRGGLSDEELVIVARTHGWPDNQIIEIKRARTFIEAIADRYIQETTPT